MATGRRGRPTALVPSEWTGSRPITSDDRIAWLLRINRLFGPDDGLAVGATFARAFKAADGGPVAASQISRWELGHQRAGYHVLRQYEELLGLKRNHLVTIADTVYREDRAGPARSPMIRTVDLSDARDRLDLLLERGLSTDPMTGDDWDELTTYLAAAPQIYIYPHRSWNELAERLVREMVISDGSGWLQRLEAVNRMLSHPQGQLPTIAACAALISDRTNQVFIDPLAVLEISPHPESARHLVAQVADPTNERAQLGAWAAVAEKIGRGHFAEPELIALCRFAGAVLDGERERSGVRVAAADLLRQAGGLVPEATRSVLRRETANDPVIRHVVISGRTEAGVIAQNAVAGLLASATSRMPREAFDNDLLLARTIDAMLFHPQVTRRVEAGFLIGATPYRRTVADAVVSQLRRRSVLQNPPFAGALLSASTFLRAEDARPLIERLILAPGLDVDVTESAVWALAHAHGTSDDQFWRAALDRHGRSAGPVPSLNESILRGLVYGLGVARNTAQLRLCAEDAEAPNVARVSAGWWLNQPDHLLTSTAHALSGVASHR